MITINGKSYVGDSITVVNGTVIIDGNVVEVKEREIKIDITGNISRLSVDACSFVRVNGNAESIKTVSGNVEVTGDVEGEVKTVSGSVRCEGNILGDTKTVSGDIKYRK